MFGFYRTAAAVPELKVADIDYNCGKIIELMEEADSNSTAAVVFPELCVSGYTCADLFHQHTLINECSEAVMNLAEASADLDIISVVGAPMLHGSHLYNCAFVLQNGKIKSIIPKSFLPNYREFYEKRWFRSGADIKGLEIEFEGERAPFGTDLIFEYEQEFSFCVEICEDLWAVIPPSSRYSAAGSMMTFNPSASDEIVSKADYRRQLVSQQSARCISGYVYASSGVHESTTDLVFSGHTITAENGQIISENERFQRKNFISYSDIDCRKLQALRISESVFADSKNTEDFRKVKLGKINNIKKLDRYIDPAPFVPDRPELVDKRCREIFSIQSAALAKRMEHTGSEKAVIGISGGLDSTLALLVCAETFKLTGKKNRNIIALTMPGFGTSDRTYKNAKKFAEALGADLREISIEDACARHFKDIGHDPSVHDVTYENTQARERTQILMDTANREKGLVIGTGDLSEIALGWSTYNADHMSMYAVNCGVPKSLVRFVIKWVAESSGEKLRKILEDIIDTPVSPELLPKGKKGEIRQKTEELIGPYELHDFFLYHCVKYGAEPGKILFLAQNAFKKAYSKKEIRKNLEIFIKRFFSQQFKRSCIPDGPKVGTINLSPRGDWRMPSDASAEIWLNNLKVSG